MMVMAKLTLPYGDQAMGRGMYNTRLQKNVTTDALAPKRRIFQSQQTMTVMAKQI